VKNTVHCPDCGVTSVTKSHRRHTFERLISPFARPYRCHVCGKRFFAGKAIPELRARMLFGPVAGILMAVALVGVIALWPLRSEVYQVLAPFSSARNALDQLQPGPLALCLFLSILVACALMMAGVLYSARRRALEDIGKRLRRVESLVKAADGVELSQELRSDLDRVSEELQAVRAELASVQEALQARPFFREPVSVSADSSPEPNLAFASAADDRAPTEEKPFDPIRDTHFEALDALRRGSLGDSEALLVRALRLCDELNQNGLSRGVIQYDLARVLACQGDSDVQRRKERYARALDRLRSSLAATDGEIHFKFMCDLERGGAFHQLASQPDFEPAVTDLMSLIQVA
jgi:hypothetical protein